MVARMTHEVAAACTRPTMTQISANKFVTSPVASFCVFSQTLSDVDNIAFIYYQYICHPFVWCVC